MTIVIFQNKYGITVRSTKNTLGISGDWILEQGSSKAVHLKDIYFTNEIDHWNHDLGVDITSTVQSNSVNGITWNSSTATYTLNSDIYWPYDTTVTDNYILLNNGQTFNGAHHKIIFGEFGTATNYGIFQSNTSNINTNLPLVKNLTILSTIMNNGGTIGGGGFVRNGQNNFSVINCHHKGDMVGINGGGICSHH